MTAIPATIRIEFDPTSLAWISELTRRLSFLNEVVPRPVEIINLVRALPRGAAAFNSKSIPTGRANEHRIVFEPCQGIVELMSTLRTLQGDIAELGHDAHSTLDNPRSVAGQGKDSSPSGTEGDGS